MKPTALPWCVLVALASTGCDGAGRDKTAAESASASAAQRPTSPWTVGDQPLKHAAALVTGTKGETALRLTLSTAPLSCESVAASFPDGAVVTRATLLDIWLMQPLEKDGAAGPWSLASAMLADGKGRRGLTAQGAQVGDVTITGQDVHIRGLDLAAMDSATGRTVMWSGDLAATFCPKVARTEPDRPQAKLTLSVADTKLPVHGATVHRNGKQHFLRLTRAPNDCATDVAEGFDFYLDLTMAGEPPTLQVGSLQGAIFPSFPSGSTGRETFTIQADGPLDGPGEVTLTVAGSLDLRGYPIKVNGEVSAIRCVQP
ncbi:MAG: hypothetical protein JRI68_07920 [Deltaproteobacteria bacterium]|nr:hypothetical protein [Deltaproteobacteria bacterium]